MTRRVVPILLLACSAAVSFRPASLDGGAEPASRLVTLANGRVTARFGDRGLVSLADSRVGQTVHLSRDEFIVELEGATLDSRQLPAPERSVAGDRATFSWTAPLYRVQVTYELAPGWRFVSKQISVTAIGVGGREDTTTAVAGGGRGATATTAGGGPPFDPSVLREAQGRPEPPRLGLGVPEQRRREQRGGTTGSGSSRAPSTSLRAPSATSKGAAPRDDSHAVRLASGSGTEGGRAATKTGGSGGREAGGASAPASFRVTRVEILRATLSEPIAGTCVPKSARPNLGTGDYGICVRLGDATTGHVAEGGSGGRRGGGATTGDASTEGGRRSAGGATRGDAADSGGRQSTTTTARGARRAAEGGTAGLLAVVQNPFLTAQRDGQDFSVTYRPELEWKTADGPFVTDRGLLALYRATGRVLPERMLPEWQMGPADAAPGMDEAEVEAFTDMVRAFLLARPPKPVNVLVGWCLNDYQIDAGTPEGRAEYRRIFDQAAALGANYVLYAPSNTLLSRREESADDWSWEHVLWLGLGQQIRKNEWDPRTSPVPPSVQEMLDSAKSKGLKLLAYVYPVLPFSQNPAWLVSPKNDPKRQYASLGVRALQDWLIEELVAFHDRLGLGGFAFDHTFLTYEGTSRYAQWAGWRRVMEEVRRRIPDIVFDGRQAYHLYGPWSWLAGSYPHPTANDEQPESFVPFPDLHVDRVSADRERFTAYRYRNYEFAPSEIVPGFITHQTSRGDDTGEMPEKKTDKGVVLLPFRERDWDDLGWRYSLLSSIAIAGWNNVLNMVPARDTAEYRAFSDADRQWFRRWINWTAANKEFLRNTRTILGQPALGKVDGTSAIAGSRGFIFLFNPNGRALTADVTLDERIGLAAAGRFALRELYPLEGRLLGKPGAGLWTAGDRVSIPMDGASAVVLELQPLTPASPTLAAGVPPAPAGRERVGVRGFPAPLVFGTTGAATLENGVLAVTGARGEVGTEATVSVLLPPGQPVAAMTVNGRRVAMTRTGDVVSAAVTFDGVPFRHGQPLLRYDPAFAGGPLSGRFTVPKRVFDQLAARQKAWPIPWTAEDFRTAWLAPERLLLFVQIAEPDDRWEARLRIDGRTVELKKAYSAVRAARRTFVGFYADLSLLAPDREHTFDLELPPLEPGRFQGVFFENVETEYTEKIKS